MNSFHKFRFKKQQQQKKNGETSLKMSRNMGNRSKLIERLDKYTKK